ncbi:Uncharacterised protein [Mycobacteroides abscessus subsp. abscessus]|nr:Uncharacterised protein [Mycobacteroides abscessus subsp. abscessus]
MSASIRNVWLARANSCNAPISAAADEVSAPTRTSIRKSCRRNSASVSVTKFRKLGSLPPAPRRREVRSTASSALHTSHCNDRRDIGVNPHSRNRYRTSLAAFVRAVGAVVSDHTNCINRAAITRACRSLSVHSGTIGDDQQSVHHSSTAGCHWA